MSDALKSVMKSECEALNLLRHLNDVWPDTLWLWAGAGTLHVMRRDENGSKAVTDSGGFDQDYVVEDYYNIDCDGGDW